MRQIIFIDANATIDLNGHVAVNMRWCFNLFISHGEHNK